MGIWRTIDSLDRHGLRASVLVNSLAVGNHPRIVEAGRERDRAWLAHGRTNPALHIDLPEDEKRAALARS